MTFSARLKELRKARGLTQAQAANGIRIKRANLGAYEEGRAEPPHEILLRIATFYRVTTDYLLTGEEFTEIKTPISYLFDKAPKGIKDSVLKLLS